MKPKPFKIFSCPQANSDGGDHWVYTMEVGQDEHTLTEYERRALLIRHAPELLHELKISFGIIKQLLAHLAEGRPLPLQTDVRHAAMDVWNVIDLAEGRKTEGTRFYPPPEDE